jgi:hypothetical protein
MVGRRAGDGFFDPVELADASRAYLAIGEPVAGCTSKDMHPTGGFGDPIAGEQRVEPGIAIGMDDAAKIPSSDALVDALPCGRVICKTAPPAGRNRQNGRSSRTKVHSFAPAGARRRRVVVDLGQAL